MRFVPVKSADQQAVLMLHRTRALLIRQQTMLANAFRAHLAEFRIVVAQAMWFDASRSVGCCYEAQFTLLRRDLSQCRRRQVLTQEKGFRGMLGCDAWYTFTVN
jgi:transposase